MTARIGDYQLVRSLAATACGVCELEATHVLLPRRAIVRVADPGAAQQLMHEACVLETVKYPGVPRLFECGELDDRRSWIAYEALDGPTLADLMLERTLAPAEQLVLLRDLVDILHHAHTQGVVHGRLAPELIVRGEDGFYITGWGTALEREPSHDLHALGSMLTYTMATPIPRAIATLLARMKGERPAAAEIHAESIRLLENVLENVDVEDVVLAEPLSAGGYS